MKLVVAIVDKNDSLLLGEALKTHNIYFTKIPTVGGFLGKGNYTLLMCVEDQQVEKVLSCLRENCSRRTALKPIGTFLEGTGPMVGEVIPVYTGGATVFVSDIEHFEKM